jgi:uncharacterized protein (TIGR00245 family)
LLAPSFCIEPLFPDVSRFGAMIVGERRAAKSLVPPRYAIPLLGMILGNCMTGIALGLDTLTTSLVSRRAGVEAQLMLGATRQEAVAPVTRQALRSALMPTINSMSATGVVSLPGMMTGQILGGVPPPGRSSAGYPRQRLSNTRSSLCS